MPNVNQVNLIGHLTRDPVFAHTPTTKTAVADIGIAINRNWTTESGEKKEEVCYIEVTLWGRLAEIAKQYLHKGSPVYVTGRLATEEWKDKNSGEKRSRLKVIADSLQLLGAKLNSGEAS